MKIHPTSFLILLLLLILAYPWLAGTHLGATFFASATLLIIVGGILETRNSKAWQLPALVLAVPTGVVALWESAAGRGGHPTFFALQTATFALISANLIVFALRPAAVTTHKISAIVSGYLMMGFAFSSVYSLLESLAPGSFSAPGSLQLETFDLFYFSFVTLTTLGYGDVVPVSHHARSIAIVEAVFGTLYLVVLVSRLVSRVGPEAERGHPAE